MRQGLFPICIVCAVTAASSSKNFDKPSIATENTFCNSKGVRIRRPIIQITHRQHRLVNQLDLLGVVAPDISPLRAFHGSSVFHAFRPTGFLQGFRLGSWYHAPLFHYSMFGWIDKMNRGFILHTRLPSPLPLPPALSARSCAPPREAVRALCPARGTCLTEWSSCVPATRRPFFGHPAIHGLVCGRAVHLPAQPPFSAKRGQTSKNVTIFS